MVFWHPDDCPHVLRVVAKQVTGSAEATPFDLSRIACRTSILVAPDKCQYVMFREGARYLQLVVSGASLLRPVHLQTDAIVHRHKGRAHLEALACLNDLSASGRLLSRHFALEPRRQRFRAVLRALDGALAGASHRDIAVALFGTARVDADWTDPGEHLRDHVRRATRRGRLLMGGGYQQFLR